MGTTLFICSPWHCCWLDLWVLPFWGLREKWPVIFYICSYMILWITAANPGCFLVCVCIIQCKKYQRLKSGLGKGKKFRSRSERKCLQIWNREGFRIHSFSLACYWNSNSVAVQGSGSKFSWQQEVFGWVGISGHQSKGHWWAHMHQLAHTRTCTHIPLQE